MYQNGERLNHYARKRMHKKKMKKAYAKTWYYGSSCGSWNSICLEVERGDYPYSPKALNYWNTFYLSGCRKYAKSCTSATLRAENRKLDYLVRHDDYEDFPQNTRKGDYRRYYDYGWCVY